jgi:hypothetical protein
MRPNTCPDCRGEFDPGHSCPEPKERWVTHHVTDPDWHPGGGHWHPHRTERGVQREGD